MEKRLLIPLLVLLGCSNKAPIEKEEPRPQNRSNCILVSSVENGKKIDEYLIDNGMDGWVDLSLKCERDNYDNSLAYLSQYTFDRIREIQGNSRLAYEIKHPESGKTIQILAETRVIDNFKQWDLNLKYKENQNK